MSTSRNSVLPYLIWVFMLLTGVSVPMDVLAVTSTPGAVTDLTGTWLGMFYRWMF